MRNLLVKYSLTSPDGTYGTICKYITEHGGKILIEPKTADTMSYCFTCEFDGNLKDLAGYARNEKIPGFGYEICKPDRKIKL